MDPKVCKTTIETQTTTLRQDRRPCDPKAIERETRDILARKVSGTLTGLWLLIPEHLRLGTWDLVCGWTGSRPDGVEPRLALQMVHEAALCRAGVRDGRSLTHRGFELANGLPFMATDAAIHRLLDAHSVAEARDLQIALAKLRRACGHYRGQRIVLDPHRIASFSRRQMPKRQTSSNEPATKLLQTFFALDADTSQPLALGIGSSSRAITAATIDLVGMLRDILGDVTPHPLLIADAEHHSRRLIEHLKDHSPFDLLLPLQNQPTYQKRYRALPPDAFVEYWPGFAIAQAPYRFKENRRKAFTMLVQRSGLSEKDYDYKGFLCTRPAPLPEVLTQTFPSRWTIEEFFRLEQDLGWKRASTLNLHIRYGQMTMALVAQAVIHQLRRKLPPPIKQWTADHLARKLFMGLDGDIRVRNDTILVTYYNAPDADHLRQSFEHMPQRLIREGVDPHIPWLYNFKLDFRFR